MSHVIDCKFAVSEDLDVLEAAAKRLGGQLNRGKKTYKWFGQHVGDYKLPAGRTKAQMGTCEHEISFPGCGYSVGVVRRPDGKPGYDLEFDFWAGGHGLVDRIGKDAGLLRQAYGVVAAKRALARQGKTAVERKLTNGQIQLVVQA